MKKRAFQDLRELSSRYAGLLWKHNLDGNTLAALGSAAFYGIAAGRSALALQKTM